MKDNILRINLETSTAPIITEARGKDYIEYGTDDWKNLYPQFLVDLYYNSSTHSAIINATAEMIAGEDIIAEDSDTNLEAYVRLKKFLRHANGKESMHQIIKKVAFDFKLQGAYALHIIWNKTKTEIAEVYHVPVERVRAGIPNEMGVVDTYFISSNWANERENPPTPIAAFNTNDRTTASQLIYAGSYSPNMDIYHTPDYIAANNWALVDQRVAEFQLSNINSGFSASFMISFANGIPTQEERTQIEQSITEKFTGASNAGKFILTFSDDKTRTPEVTSISPSDLDKQFLALQELLVSNICAGHRVTSKTLMGIDTSNGFSSNADELVNASNFYQNTVIRPFQLNILDTLSMILSVNNIDLELEFVQLKPVTVQFDSKTIREVMTQDEVREDIGLPALEVDEQAIDDSSKFSKVGMIDGKPIFSTTQEAEAHAATLGCSGYHEHDYEGKVAYMACEGHTEATELSSFIAEFGEDITEEWELIDEEVVDGEHKDFDYEYELNRIADEKFGFASTLRANPNARDDEDGLNKTATAFFKVRYIYTTDRSAPDDTGESRDFCRAMLSANKVYRKKDIIETNSNRVNPGFGHNGAAYNLFLWKGGPNCRHYWKRKIYKAIPESDTSVFYPENIQSNEVLDEGKEASEGFALGRNPWEVAVAPRVMSSRGYYN
jgi:hypothetical protein